MRSRLFYILIFSTSMKGKEKTKFEKTDFYFLQQGASIEFQKRISTCYNISCLLDPDPFFHDLYGRLLTDPLIQLISSFSSSSYSYLSPLLIMHNTGFFISFFFVSIRHGSYGLFAVLLFVYKRLLQLFWENGIFGFCFLVSLDCV